MDDSKMIAMRDAGPAMVFHSDRHNTTLWAGTGEQSGFAVRANSGLRVDQRSLLSESRAANEGKVQGITASFYLTTMYTKVRSLARSGVFRKPEPGEHRLSCAVNEQ